MVGTGKYERREGEDVERVHVEFADFWTDDGTLKNHAVQISSVSNEERMIPTLYLISWQVFSVKKL